MARRQIPNALRREVIERAAGRCEYCLIHENDAPESHQLDHLIALKHGGKTVSENLALACIACNSYKGSDVASIDPVHQMIVPLYNPRVQKWEDHFQVVGAAIIGLSPIGRATIGLLRLNEDDRLATRRALVASGHYPPSEDS